jgi:hypothetical protein
MRILKHRQLQPHRGAGHRGPPPVARQWPSADRWPSRCWESQRRRPLSLRGGAILSRKSLRAVGLPSRASSMAFLVRPHHPEAPRRPTWSGVDCPWLCRGRRGPNGDLLSLRVSERDPRGFTAASSPWALQCCRDADPDNGTAGARFVNRRGLHSINGRVACRHGRVRSATLQRASRP